MVNEIGSKFERWTVLREVPPTGKFKAKTYECACVCGTVRAVVRTSLVQGKSKSCGCLKKEITSKIMTTHGMSTSIEYRHYAAMQDRCFNPNNKHYKDYGARGLTVCQEFVDDFLAFYKDIGPKPKDGKRWSVGRQDNNKGYVIGNVAWELDEQQARNHSLQRNNTSGVAGISIRYTKSDGDRVVARYNTLDGNRISKSFSIGTRSVEDAMAQAVEWRNARIHELNEMGAGYAESHGTEKVFHD